MINKDKLKQFVEPHFHTDICEDEYEIQTMKANKLLTNNRLDIAFKLLYLEMLEFDVAFAKEIYKAHIRAFSLGKFIEPGNDDKNGIEKYVEDFNIIFESIKTEGFDSNKTLIPLSQNESVANGAHRVASAIFLAEKVACVKLNTYNHIYDYRFFYQRNIPRSILDIGVTKFIEYADNTYIAFIWPVAKSSDAQIESVVPNIVYRKDITLNPNGAHNLLSQIYYGEEWLGNVENNFSGAKGKLFECFKTFDPVRVIAFQADNLDEVLKIKEKIRKVFNVGKHSVHITDTKEEAIRTARIVFNDNSIHFLNYAKPNKYISTHKKIDTFNKFIKANNLNSNDVLLDSSIVLSAYGLREAKDTDYFCNDNHKIKVKLDDINMHDGELQYYDENKYELIYNPRYHFYFNNLKFISFEKLYDMKTKRAQEKDRNDCRIMEALLENNKFKGFVNKLKQNILYGQIILRQKIIRLLQKTGLFELVRNVYRKIKSFNE